MRVAFRVVILQPNMMEQFFQDLPLFVFKGFDPCGQPILPAIVPPQEEDHGNQQRPELPEQPHQVHEVVHGAFLDSVGEKTGRARGGKGRPVRSGPHREIPKRREGD